MSGSLPPTALELAQAIRRGETSSAALVEEGLARARGPEAALGAFVELLPRAARAEARRRDRQAPRGPLHGLPTGIKDLDLVAGSFTRAGSRALRWAWTPFDGPIARRVRAGGMVVTGKLATSELALLPVVETDLHPPCRNPWNPGHSAGGSSGGSAAAVAAGLLPIAPGSDGGGSIRIPAAFCHVFGFKPSRGPLSAFYARVDPMGLSCAGALSQDVADAAALLDLLSGTALPAEGPPPPGTHLAASGEPVPSLRVRVCLSSPLAELHPGVGAAVERTAALLSSLGHRVEAAPAMPDRYEPFIALYARIFAAVPLPCDGSLQAPTRFMRQLGRRQVEADSQESAAAMLRDVEAWWGDADVMLTPTVAGLPPAVGAWRDLAAEALLRQAATIGAFTAPFNLSGQPAASLPAGLVEGLPCGVQLAARRGRDDLLLALCRQVERAAPWRLPLPAR